MSKSKKKKTNILRTIDEYFIFFIICSFLGWVYEVLWELLIWGNGFINRGTMYGPWIPVYGIGGVLISIIFYRFVKDKDLKTKLIRIIPLFIGIFILTSAIELITSYICEIAIGYIPWDYTMFTYTIDDRVSLLTSTIFGIGGLIFIYILKPATDKILSKISDKRLNIITIILVSIFIIDFICAKAFGRNDLPLVNENIKYYVIEVEDLETNINKLNGKIIKTEEDYINLFGEKNPDLDFHKYSYIALAVITSSCDDLFIGIKAYNIKSDSITLDQIIQPGCGFCARLYEFYLYEFTKDEIKDIEEIEFKEIYDGEKHCRKDVDY